MWAPRRGEQSFHGAGHSQGWAHVALGVAIAALVLLLGGVGAATLAWACAALAYAATAFLLFVRPAVVVRDDGLLLRGDVRDVLVPWATIEEVAPAGSGLRVVAGGRALRARGFGGSVPRALTSSPSGGPSPHAEVGLYSEHVADKLREAVRRQAGHAEPAGAASESPRSWTRWELVAVPAGLVLVAVVLLLVD